MGDIGGKAARDNHRSTIRDITSRSARNIARRVARQRARDVPRSATRAVRRKTTRSRRDWASTTGQSARSSSCGVAWVRQATRHFASVARNVVARTVGRVSDRATIGVSVIKG